MPFLIALIFAALGALHLYWAAGGRPPDDAVLPQLEGRPLFVPGRAATAPVGLLLWSAGALVLAAAGGVAMPWSARGCWALAGIMAIRAVGDFRYVGFFKSVRTGRFAALDTMYYSPLCLALAAGIGWTAFTALK
jgi:Protein of unknown function (DUF3995)